MEKPIWAAPGNVTSVDECIFYHTMDIPDHGTVIGEWDLRGGESSYLGEVRLYTIVGRRAGLSSSNLRQTVESNVAIEIDDAASVLEEMTLKRIRLSRLAKHVLRRGIREVPRRILTGK